LRNLIWRIVIVLIIVAAALWTLWPTFQFYTMSPEEKAQLTRTELLNLKKRAINLGLDLQGGMYLLLEVDKSKLSPEEQKGAVDRALEVIRNRIDQWGVFEPSIQKAGENRILIQLPGILDRERARSLIGKTAQLEFRLVAQPKVLSQVIDLIDEKLTSKDSLAETFSSLLLQYKGGVAVMEDNWSKVDSILSLEEIKKVIPKNYVFMWGKTEITRVGEKLRPLYLVKAKPELTGAYLKSARHTIYQGQDPAYQGKPIVELHFDKKGAAKFAYITGKNIGRQLAIVLDNIVQSAPFIDERIPTGDAIIRGNFTMDEAKELAVILRAGSLPAPVKIVEERSVGPLLGRDSVRKGIRALMVGLILVMIFMAIYYNLSGLIADLALVLNIILILGALVALHATLTLPGMAGLILTVGMAVDANVLIFERIREELRAGKRPKNAVDAGYHRALITIFDANLTTLIAALVLLRFGTGPIRGFGTTLSLGIIVSFFTAIFVTKIIFDYFLVVKRAKTIKI